MTRTTCTCPIHRQQLYAVIEGVRHKVEPAAADSPTSTLFRAWCSSCRAEYPHPFRLATAQRRSA